MQHKNISEVLRYLMFKDNLRTADLARRVNIPQQTLQRIVAGLSTNPHEATLMPIAQYFNITLSQLSGLEPLETASTSLQTPSWRALPVLTWDEVKNRHQLTPTELAQKNKIYVDLSLSDAAYALEIKDSAMAPIYPADTVLLVDPAHEMGDKRYVIVHLHDESRAIVRLVTTDGRDFYLKLLNPDLSAGDLIKFTPKDTFCGVVVQVRRDLL